LIGISWIYDLKYIFLLVVKDGVVFKRATKNERDIVTATRNEPLLRWKQDFIADAGISRPGR